MDMVKVNKEDLKNLILNILAGIDKTEIESPEGWWETSSGAEFGKERLQQLIVLINLLEPVSEKTPTDGNK